MEDQNTSTEGILMFFKPIKTQRLTENVYAVKTLISNYYV